MHLDVLDLRNFYYRTRLGRAAQKAVRDQLVALWPPRAGETVAGFGFAVPLLRPYLADARRVIGLMPGPQGVMPWPVGMPNVSVLCEETLWPLPNACVDRLVLMHGLETSENPSSVLEEAALTLGAKPWQIFTRVLFPLSAGGILAGFLMCFGWNLGVFAQPLLLGGPREQNVLSVVLYDKGMIQFNYGLAAAMGVVLMALAFFVTWLSLRLSRGALG